MTRLSYPGNIWGNILQFRLAPNPTPGPLPLVNSWNAPSETFVLNPSQSSRLPASRLVRLGTHILQSGCLEWHEGMCVEYDKNAGR